MTYPEILSTIQFYKMPWLQPMNCTYGRSKTTAEVVMSQWNVNPMINRQQTAAFVQASVLFSTIKK
jgi:hypothetical protein